MSNNELNGPTALKAHAYAAGRKAWEAQRPREAPHEYSEEEKRKWLAGYDARKADYAIEGS